MAFSNPAFLLNEQHRKDELFRCVLRFATPVILLYSLTSLISVPKFFGIASWSLLFAATISDIIIIIISIIIVVIIILIIGH